MTRDLKTISGTMLTTDSIAEDPTPDIDTFSYPAPAILVTSSGDQSRSRAAAGTKRRSPPKFSLALRVSFMALDYSCMR